MQQKPGISLLSSVVILSVGYLLLKLKIPMNSNFKKVSAARNALVSAYFVLAFLGLAKIFLLTMPLFQKDTGLYVLISASFQALMFTYALLLFITPGYIIKKRIIFYAGILFIVCLALLALRFVFCKTQGDLIQVIAVVIYLLFILHCAFLFQNKYKYRKEHIPDACSKEDFRRLYLVRVYFFASFCVGIIAAVVIYLPQWVYCVFLIAYTCYYVYFAGKFYNYLMKYYMFMPDMSTPGLSCSSFMDDDDMDVKMKNLSLSLDAWVAGKKFLKVELSREEIALDLKTDKRLLQYYFSVVVKEDFRTWRTKLRIKEAQEIMLNNPDIPISVIAEMSGFSDRSNFTNQFKKMTGQTPKDWLSQQKCNNEQA